MISSLRCFSWYLKKGAGFVYPFALANTAGSGGQD